MNIDEHRFQGVIGQEYDLFQLAVPHHDIFQARIAHEIQEFCAASQQEVLLAVEAGTGTGITTLRVLEVDERIKIIGIDNEEKIFTQAEKNLEKYKNRIELRQKDIYKALKEMPDNAVDIFFSAYTIHNFPPVFRQQVFQEIARVTKKGGLFINGDKYARQDKVLHQEDLNKQIEQFQVFSEQGRDDLRVEWTQHYHDDEKIKITDKEQMTILNNLGYDQVQVVYRVGMEAIISGRKSRS